MNGSAATSSARPRPDHRGRRRCVGCGARVPYRQARRQLVRLVVVPAAGSGDLAFVADLAHRGAGRGAWVHPRHRCLEEAARRGLARALRRPVRCRPEELARAISEAAERRLEGLLSAAIGAGRAVVGATGATAALRRGRVALLVYAEDASRLPAAVVEALRQGQGLGWGTRARLGALAGRSETAVLAIVDEGLASAVRRAAGLAAGFGSEPERSTEQVQ